MSVRRVKQHGAGAGDTLGGLDYQVVLMAQHGADDNHEGYPAPFPGGGDSDAVSPKWRKPLIQACVLLALDDILQFLWVQCDDQHADRSGSDVPAPGGVNLRDLAPPGSFLNRFILPSRGCKNSLSDRAA